MVDYKRLYPLTYKQGIEIHELVDSYATPSAYVKVSDVLAKLDPWLVEPFNEWVKNVSRPYSESVYPWALEVFFRKELSNW